MDVTTGFTVLDDPPLRAGFELVVDAGRPVELVFRLRWLGSRPAFLAMHGDRGAGRSGDYEVTALLSGSPVLDPAAQAPQLGGPATAVRLVPGEDRAHHLALDRFVELDDVTAGRLELRCRRRLMIAATREEAMTAPPTSIEVSLSVELPG